MIKIGIDPSGTGTTTGIVVYEDNKLTEKQKFTNKDWIYQANFILCILNENEIINIEDCLYTNANGSNDRDDLLKIIGVIKYDTHELNNVNWVSPRYTKSVVKNMENLSKYNDSCMWEYEKDNNLTYQYGKCWKYNNEKISNHIRDAIIIANYEGKNNEN